MPEHGPTSAAHHHHAHDLAPRDFGRAFAIGIGLNLSYVAAEATVGIVAGSLALLADAGHNLADVLGLCLAWAAAVLSRRGPSGRYTYGFSSSSILAALANAIILLVVTGGILWEGIRRLLHPEPVDSTAMIWVAAAGILINGGTALLFSRQHRHDLNVKSAFFHMAADTLVTAGVVAAGITIALTGWQWLDPAVSLSVSIVIIIGSWGIVRSALDLALDAVPESVDPEAVRRHLLDLPGVTGLHDLHIWGMSTTETALTCHLVMPSGHPGDALLVRTAQELHDRFGIAHATIQIEVADTDEVCVLTPEHVV